jgi:hypothetical protein
MTGAEKEGETWAIDKMDARGISAEILLLLVWKMHNNANYVPNINNLDVFNGWHV